MVGGAKGWLGEPKGGWGSQRVVGGAKGCQSLKRLAWRRTADSQRFATQLLSCFMITELLKIFALRSYIILTNALPTSKSVFPPIPAFEPEAIDISFPQFCVLSDWATYPDEPPIPTGSFSRHLYAIANNMHPSMVSVSPTLATFGPLSAAAAASFSADSARSLLFSPAEDAELDIGGSQDLPGPSSLNLGTICAAQSIAQASPATESPFMQQADMGDVFEQQCSTEQQIGSLDLDIRSEVSAGEFGQVEQEQSAARVIVESIHPYSGNISIAANAASSSATETLPLTCSNLAQQEFSNLETESNLNRTSASIHDVSAMSPVNVNHDLLF